jgi:hypothetical protein
MLPNGFLSCTVAQLAIAIARNVYDASQIAALRRLVLFRRLLVSSRLGKSSMKLKTQVLKRRCCKRDMFTRRRAEERGWVIRIAARFFFPSEQSEAASFLSLIGLSEIVADDLFYSARFK